MLRNLFFLFQISLIIFNIKCTSNNSKSNIDEGEILKTNLQEEEFHNTDKESLIKSNESDLTFQNIKINKTNNNYFYSSTYNKVIKDNNFEIFLKIENKELKKGTWLKDKTENIKSTYSFLEKINFSKIDDNSLKYFKKDFLKIDRLIEVINNFEKNFKSLYEKFIKGDLSEEDFKTYIEKNIKDYFAAICRLENVLNNLDSFINKKQKNEISYEEREKIRNNLDFRLKIFFPEKITLEDYKKKFEDKINFYKKETLKKQHFGVLSATTNSEESIGSILKKFPKISKDIDPILNDLYNCQSFFESKNFSKLDEIKEDPKYSEIKDKFIESFKNLYKILFKNDKIAEDKFKLRYVGKSLNKKEKFDGISLDQLNFLRNYCIYLTSIFSFVESQGQIILPLTPEKEYSSYFFDKNTISKMEVLTGLAAIIGIVFGAIEITTGVLTLPFSPALAVELIILGSAIITATVVAAI